MRERTEAAGLKSALSNGTDESWSVRFPERVPEVIGRRLVCCYILLLLQGHYQPGARLPRQHDLAKETGVSFGTLKVALELLEREGYLVRKVGQGTYAALPEETAAVALIIDNDPKFCSYVTEGLAICGWGSLTATSGQAGLEKLREASINLILLDLVLPGMDGAQIFREVRKLDQEVPVVIVTGFPDSDIMFEALKVGPFAIVRKPFGLDQLSHIVERLFPKSARPAGARPTFYPEITTAIRPARVD